MEQHLVDVVGLQTCHPQGLISSTLEVSHTQQGVDSSEYADLEQSELEIGGVETAILIKSISTFIQKPNFIGWVFFYFIIFIILSSTTT